MSIEHLARMPQVPGDRVGSREVFCTCLFYCFLAASTYASHQVERTNLFTGMPEQIRDVMQSLRILESRGLAFIGDGPIVAFAAEYAFGLTGYSIVWSHTTAPCGCDAGRRVPATRRTALLEAQVAGVVDHLFQCRGDQDFAPLASAAIREARMTVLP